jgi:hypothetical protein
VTGLLLLALAAVVAPPATERIVITGREMVGLRDRQDVIRGTCDGRPASATITKAYRGAAGSIVLRAGRWTREVPRGFLDDLLLTSSFQSSGISCDGRRLELHALVLHENAQREFVMSIQNATLDMRTGRLSVDEMRTLSPAETRSENSPRR